VRESVGAVVTPLRDRAKPEWAVPVRRAGVTRRGVAGVAQASKALRLKRTETGWCSGSSGSLTSRRP
jgi:hypothetical protein